MWRTVSKLGGAGLIFVIIMALMTPALAPAVERPDSFADLAAKVSSAVVNIRAVKTVKQSGVQQFFSSPDRGSQDQERKPFDPYEFFRPFFGPNGPSQQQPKEYKQRSLGSGVIVDHSGYVLTNNHVVAGADEISIKLKNGKEYEAVIKGRDPKTDLALIKIQTDDELPSLPLGDSDAMQVGDWVIAVGNPFGLENTVTAGIVSAKGRAIGAGVYDNFIQTDASINPGNSGGPLINLKGEVIGINTAIVAQGQGIGFAIPVNMAKNIMAQLKEKGRVVRGYFGVSPQKLTDKLAKQFNMKDTEGVLVARVEKDSPADKGGLKRGDIIVDVNGKEIPEPGTLYRVVADLTVGDKIQVKVMREGKEMTLSVTVGERPDEKVAGQEPTEKKGKLGLGVQNITPEMARQLGLADTKGVIVTRVLPGSPAEEAGLRRGDVILEVGHQPVEDVDMFYDEMVTLKKGEGVLLLVQRGEITQYLVLKLPE